MPRSPATHLGVGRHDGVVPIIVTVGGFDVQGAGPVSFSPHSAVLASLRDLLPIFEPINLEGEGAVGEDFVLEPRKYETEVERRPCDKTLILCKHLEKS